MSKKMKALVAIAAIILAAGAIWGSILIWGGSSSSAPAHAADQTCEQLQSQFAVPAQQCTTEDVTPRPLGELAPPDRGGACWPAHKFHNPAEAGAWLASDQGQIRADQYSQFASGHRDYYGYTGQNGADYAAYTSGLVREELPYPIRVLNHYCEPDGVKVWQVQVLPKGEPVYFLAGFAPSQVSIKDIKPVDKEACGNPLLPPPPPPPACPPGTAMAGKPLPPQGVSGCNPPETPGTTPPGSTTTTKATTIPPTTTRGGKDVENANSQGKPGHGGGAPPQADPQGPPRGGTPPPAYTTPTRSTQPTTPRPAPTSNQPPVTTVDPTQTHTTAPPPPTDW